MKISTNIKRTAEPTLNLSIKPSKKHQKTGAELESINGPFKTKNPQMN